MDKTELKNLIKEAKEYFNILYRDDIEEYKKLNKNKLNKIYFFNYGEYVKNVLKCENYNYNPEHYDVMDYVMFKRHAALILKSKLFSKKEILDFSDNIFCLDYTKSIEKSITEITDKIKSLVNYWKNTKNEDYVITAIKRLKEELNTLYEITKFI